MTLYGLLAEVDDALAAQEGEAAPRRSRRSLEEVVLGRLREYAASLQGHTAQDLYGLIMPQLERPLVRVAMELAEGRQRDAARMLGIHRNTLRVRLAELGLEPDPRPRGRGRDR